MKKQIIKLGDIFRIMASSVGFGPQELLVFVERIYKVSGKTIVKLKKIKPWYPLFYSGLEYELEEFKSIIVTD